MQTADRRNLPLETWTDYETIAQTYKSPPQTKRLKGCSASRGHFASLCSHFVSLCGCLSLCVHFASLLLLFCISLAVLHLFAVILHLFVAFLRLSVVVLCLFDVPLSFDLPL